jgi:hypothetical protein
MTHCYEFTRAAGGKGLVLIFAEGAFENLPFEVRLAAPWVGHGYGKAGELKPAERLQLRDVGYVILRETNMDAQSGHSAWFPKPAAGSRALQQAA